MSATNTATQPPAQQPSAPPPVQPTVTPGGETLDQALTRAQAAAQAKRLNEAAGICNDVLAVSPDYPSGLALLGIISALQNEPEKGIGLLDRAIRLRPGNASGTPTWRRSAAPPTGWSRRCRRDRSWCGWTRRMPTTW